LTFSIILLGVLIILVSFNVGESVYRKLGLKKKTLILFLLLTFVLYFVPNLTINGVTLSWIGFFLPTIFSVIVLFRVKNAKEYFKMFVAALISFALNIIYNLITFDVYEAAIFQPYLFLGVLLGIALLILVRKPSRVYVCTYFGVIFAEIVFYMSRYSIYGDFYLTLGSRKLFETLLTAFAISLFGSFVGRKFKVISIKRKLLKREQEA